MKIAILAAALGLFVWSPAFAAKGDQWFGVHLGGSIPVGDFRDGAKPGPHGSVMSSIITKDRVGVGLVLSYHDWGAADLSRVGWPVLPGSYADASAYQISLHVTQESVPLGSAILYGTGGFGATWVHSRVSFVFPGSRIRTTDSDLGYNINVGCGIENQLTPGRRLGIGVLYQIVQTKGPAADIVSVGLTMRWKSQGKLEKMP